MGKTIFVTGGCGFVGIHTCLRLLKGGYKVTCFDKLDPRTANPQNVDILNSYKHFRLIKGDVLDRNAVENSLKNCDADAIVHLAAISSVDRSIKNPTEAVEINTFGTLNLLEAARSIGIKRIHYVSTDEIFGQATDTSFQEQSASNPRNPYAAGKLGGEGIVLAWGNTYNIHVTITNSANNYGPYQAPEKLIPRLMVRGLLGNTLPVYGDGKQVREWLFIEDHADAIVRVLEQGKRGNRYCVGSSETKQNIEIVNMVLKFLNLDKNHIEYVKGRSGADLRYAVNSSKIKKLGWESKHNFERCLEQTLAWYKDNRDWWEYYVDAYQDLAPQ